MGIRDHTHCVSTSMRFRVAHSKDPSKNKQRVSSEEGVVASGQGNSGRLPGGGRH